MTVILDSSTLNQCNGPLVYLGTLTRFINPFHFKKYMNNPAGMQNSSFKKREMFSYVEYIPEPQLPALLEEVRKSVKVREGNLRCFRLPPDAERFPVLTAIRSTFLSSRACIFWKITLKAFCISLSKSIFFALVLINFVFAKGQVYNEVTALQSSNNGAKEFSCYRVYK